MPTLITWIDHDTKARLDLIARERGVRPEDLADAAVADAALRAFRNRRDDPAAPESLTQRQEA